MLNQLKSKLKRLLMIWRCLRWGISNAHSTAYFAPNSSLSRDIVAGPYSFINVGCDIGPNVEIGAYTMLGPQVLIVGDDHVFDLPSVPIIFAGRPELVRRTVIGRDVWIGAGAVILAGVHIHDGAVVAARSVVTKDVEPFSVVAGVPARKLKERFMDIGQRCQHIRMLDELGVSFGGHYIAPKPFF